MAYPGYGGGGYGGGEKSNENFIASQKGGDGVAYVMKIKIKRAGVSGHDKIQMAITTNGKERKHRLCLIDKNTCWENDIYNESMGSASQIEVVTPIKSSRAKATRSYSVNPFKIYDDRTSGPYLEIRDSTGMSNLSSSVNTIRIHETKVSHNGERFKQLYYYYDKNYSSSSTVDLGWIDYLYGFEKATYGPGTHTVTFDETDIAIVFLVQAGGGGGGGADNKWGLFNYAAGGGGGGGGGAASFLYHNWYGNTGTFTIVVGSGGGGGASRNGKADSGGSGGNTTVTFTSSRGQVYTCYGGGGGGGADGNSAGGGGAGGQASTEDTCWDGLRCVYGGNGGSVGGGGNPTEYSNFAVPGSWAIIYGQSELILSDWYQDAYFGLFDVQVNSIVDGRCGTGGGTGSQDDRGGGGGGSYLGNGGSY